MIDPGNQRVVKKIIKQEINETIPSAKNHFAPLSGAYYRNLWPRWQAEYHECRMGRGH